MRPLGQSPCPLALALWVTALLFLCAHVEAVIQSSSVVPVSLSAGVETEVVVAFTTTVAVASGSKIVITFPSDFSVSSAAAITVTNSTNYAWTLSVSSTTSSSVYALVGSADIEAATALAFTISRVTNPAAGTTGSYAIETKDSSGNVLDSNSQVPAVTIASTSFSVVSVAPDSLVAGYAGKATVTFTSDVGLSVGSLLVVTFPSVFTVASTALSSLSNLGASSSIASVSNNVVTITIGGSAISAGTSVSLKVNGITNPGATTTVPFVVVSSDASGFIFQEYEYVAGVTISSSDFSVATLRPNSLLAGMKTSWTLNVETAVAVPANGWLIVEMPSDIMLLSQVVLVDVASVRATVTASVVNHTLTFQLLSPLSSGSYDFCIQSVRNSGVSTTSTIPVYSTDTNGFVLQSAMVSGITFVSGDITNARFSAANSHPGISSKVHLTFTTSAALQPDSFLYVQLPSGDYNMTLSAPSIEFTSPTGYTAAASWDHQNTGLLILMTGATTVESNSTISLLMTAFDMPPSVRAATTTAATMQSWNGAGLKLDGPSFLAMDEVTAVQGLSCAWSTSKPNPGITSNVILTFATNGALPIGGQVKITLPAYDFLSSTADSTPTINFVSPSGISASSVWNHTLGTLTFTIDGGVSIPAYTAAAQVTIYSLDTPISARASRSSATLATYDSLGVIIDGPSIITMDAITPGLILGSRTWTPINAVAGVSSDQIIEFFVCGKLSVGSQLVFTTPTGSWGIPSTTPATFTTPNLGTVGNTIWDASTSTMIITLGGATDIAAYSIVTLVVSSISNPPKETGSGESYLTTLAPDGLAIDGPGSIAVSAILKGAVSGDKTWTSVTTVSASMMSDQELSITLSGALPSGSFLAIVLPNDGWRIESNPVRASITLPVSGVEVNSTSWSASSNTLVVETLGDLSEGTAVKLLVHDVINPYSSQAASVLSVTTTLADSGIVDESSDIAVNAILSTALSTVGSWTSGTATPGITSTQVIQLRTGGSLEAGATLQLALQLTDEWAVLYTATASLIIGSSPSNYSSLALTWDPLIGNLALTTPVAIPQESNLTIEISDMRSPPSVRDQQIASILIQSHLGKDANFGSVSINAFTVGALTGNLTWQSLLLAPGPVASLETSAVLSFQATGRIPVRGGIKIVLPSDWVFRTSCVAVFSKPSITGITSCDQNKLTIILADMINDATAVEVTLNGVMNPPTVQSSGIASGQTVSYDGGLIAETATIVTGPIVADLLSIISSGDSLVAVVGVKKKFVFQGDALQEGDVIKFVDSSTTNDANCGTSTTGVSDTGGIDVLYLDANSGVDMTFTQSSVAGEPFVICYKFGDNPFKLYRSFPFTVKEVESITSNVGSTSIAVANYAKNWTFVGNGFADGDLVRWIDKDVVDNAALTLTTLDCLDTTTLATLVPDSPLASNEDAYTRVIQLPAQNAFNFDASNAGKSFCLCYKFDNEPYVIYPSLTIEVKNLISLQAVSTGSDDVAVVDAVKTFSFGGDGLLVNDRVYFIEVGSATSCAASSINPSLRLQHTIVDQLQTTLFISGTLATDVNFTSTGAGKLAMVCWQFGTEPFQLYSSLQIYIKMITKYTGTLGSSSLAVARVPEPLYFIGYGLAQGDQVRWILHGEEDCESNLASLVDPDTLLDINTITLNGSQFGSFNFSQVQVDYNPLLCYKFGQEGFKLYTSISISIGTLTGMSSTTGAKDIAVVGARKTFVLFGTNLAAGDRVGWTMYSSCANLSLLIRDTTTTDGDYLSYTTSDNSVGVAIALQSSGNRLYLCYGFGSEPLRLYKGFYMDIRSILTVQTLIGSPNAAVAGALKTFLFQGDGVAAGDFAKFVSGTNCSEPGITLTNIIKEFDDYDEMAMYLYDNIDGVAVGSFRFGTDQATAGLGRVLCYRFATEPFYFYSTFSVDVLTVFGFSQSDAARSGQANVAVVNEPKLMAIDGVGMSAKDSAKFVVAGASTDQDCLDLPSLGLVFQQIKVFDNQTLWFPFEYGSNGTNWVLCYKFNNEQYRIYSDITVTVKEITSLLDAKYVNVSAMGLVATINQAKTWVPLGSGIFDGDTAKFVPQSVLSSTDCGVSSGNTAGGTSTMQVASTEFTGTFTLYPSSLSDVYHLCYKFQDEPYSYIQGIEISTYGIVSIDRSMILMNAATPIQINGFRISDTDQLAWSNNATSCSNAIGLATIQELQAVATFSAAYSQLYLCYSFDNQPATPFPSISISVVKAEVWIPATISIVADQQVEFTLSGTFGLTISTDQIAWVPVTAISCSDDTIALYTNIMQTSIVSTAQSTTNIARAGSAVIDVTFVPPSDATFSTDILSTWKLCYQFGNMAGFLMFGDVLCNVLNIEQVELLDSHATEAGTSMNFHFDGTGIQDFDVAKWVSATDSSQDSDCDALPAVGGSVSTTVINSMATFLFVQQCSAMVLCYQFKDRSYKLYSTIPVKSSATSATAGLSTADTSLGTIVSADEVTAAASEFFNVNRDIATVSLTLDKDINDLPSGSAAETTFKVAFASTLTTALGISSSRIQILSLTAGSVIVSFQLLPSDNIVEPLVHEALSDLQAQILDPTSSLLANNDLIKITNGHTALSYTISTPAAAAADTIAISALGYQQNGLFQFVKSIYSVTEKSTQVIIPILRLQGTNSLLTLPVRLATGSTATFNQDYSIAGFNSDGTGSLFLRFEIGETYKTIAVEILDDTVKEAYFESFTMIMDDPTIGGAALGDVVETTVRIYEYDEGNVLISSSFPSPSGSRKDVSGWSVVANGRNLLRVDTNGLYASDEIFGTSEYDQSCDYASPTGACSYVCDVGADLGSTLAISTENNALKLSGQDYLVTLSAIATFPSSAFTFSFWVKTMQRTPEACIASYIITSEATATVPFAVCNPSNLRVRIHSNSDRESGLSTFVDVADDRWHFVAIMWNAEDGRLYVYDNGMLVFDGGPFHEGETLESGGLLLVGQLTLSSDTTPCVSTVVSETLDAVLLDPSVDVACDTVSGHGFIGQLQHIHLWSRTLAQSELLKELAWPMQVVTNGLLLGWNVDESYLLNNQRTLVNDFSSSGQADQNIGVLHCTSTTASCLSAGTVPSLAPSFPCGQVYSNIWQFAAPAPFLAQLASAYAGRLQFRMLAPSFNGAPRPRRGMLSIIGAGNLHISLSLGTFALPSKDSWTYYSAVLREDFGWISEPSGAAVSAQTFQAVLASAKALWIRGDIWGYSASTGHQGQEVVYLNDITLMAK